MMLANQIQWPAWYRSFQHYAITMTVHQRKQRAGKQSNQCNGRLCRRNTHYTQSR